MRLYKRFSGSRPVGTMLARRDGSGSARVRSGFVALSERCGLQSGHQRPQPAYTAESTLWPLWCSVAGRPPAVDIAPARAPG